MYPERCSINRLNIFTPLYFVLYTFQSNISDGHITIDTNDGCDAVRRTDTLFDFGVSAGALR